MTSFSHDGSYRLGLFGILVILAGCVTLEHTLDCDHGDDSTDPGTAPRENGDLLDSTAARDVVQHDVTDLGSWTFQWTELVALNPPPPRHYGAAIYDPRGDRVLWFGGVDSIGRHTAEVWALDLKSLVWYQLPPIDQVPEARAGFVLVFDPLVGQVILSGGGRYAQFRGDNHFYFNDIWTAVLETANLHWKRRSPNDWQVDPLPVMGAMGIFDCLTRRLVVHGGGCLQCPPAGVTGTTVTFDVDTLDAQWQIVAPTAAPGMRPRMSASVWLDETWNSMVVAGGFDYSGEQLMRDVWAMPLDQPGSWALVDQEVSRPVDYAACSAVWDPVEKMAVMHGCAEEVPGKEYAWPTSDIWAFTMTSPGSGRWHRFEVLGDSPPSAGDSAMVYDSRRDRFIRVFGSHYDPTGLMHQLNQTWAASRIRGAVP